MTLSEFQITTLQAKGSAGTMQRDYQAHAEWHVLSIHANV